MTKEKNLTRRHPLKGMQDESLAVIPEVVWSSLYDRRTARPSSKPNISLMASLDRAFTREELVRVRAEIADATIVIHHGKTPLPFPRQ